MIGHGIVAVKRGNLVLTPQGSHHRLSLWALLFNTIIFFEMINNVLLNLLTFTF